MVRPRGCAQFSHQELKREDREGLKAGVVVIYKAAKRGEGHGGGPHSQSLLHVIKKTPKAYLHACIKDLIHHHLSKRSLSCLPTFISKARRTWASIKTHLYFLFPFYFNPSFHVLCLPLLSNVSLLATSTLVSWLLPTEWVSRWVLCMSNSLPHPLSCCRSRCWYLLLWHFYQSNKFAWVW